MPRDQSLASGLLGNQRLVLYTVPDGMRAKIHWVSLFNDSGGNVVATISTRKQGEYTRIGRVTLAAGGGSARVVDRDENLVLSEGDALLGGAGTADVIEYFVTGSEEPDEED